MRAPRLCYHLIYPYVGGWILKSGACQHFPTPVRVLAVLPPFGRLFRVSKWIYFTYSLVALKTTELCVCFSLLYPGSGKYEHGLFSVSGFLHTSFHSIRSGVPIVTVSLSLSPLSVWSLSLLLCRICSISAQFIFRRNCCICWHRFSVSMGVD